MRKKKKSSIVLPSFFTFKSLLGYHFLSEAFRKLGSKVLHNHLHTHKHQALPIYSTSGYVTHKLVYLFAYCLYSEEFEHHEVKDFFHFVGCCIPTPCPLSAFYSYSLNKSMNSNTSNINI